MKRDPTDKNQLQKSDGQKTHNEIENRQQRKPVQITLPKFNISKLFYDILSLANKDEDFLMMISNILTTGSRQLVRLVFFSQNFLFLQRMIKKLSSEKKEPLYKDLTSPSRNI